MLCATIRRTPADFAATTRLRVPSTRSRALRSRPASYPGVPGAHGRSVSWWMMTCGRAISTVCINFTASNTSTTTGSTPSAISAATLSAERVVPTTLWPAARKSGVRRRPIAPPAPAKNIINEYSPPRTQGLFCSLAQQISIMKSSRETCQSGAVRDLQVSKNEVLEQLLLKRQIGYKTLLAHVLVFQFLHPLGLIDLQPTVFLVPAIKTLQRYAASRQATGVAFLCAIDTSI